MNYWQNRKNLKKIVKKKYIFIIFFIILKKKIEQPVKNGYTQRILCSYFFSETPWYQDCSCKNLEVLQHLKRKRTDRADYSCTGRAKICPEFCN